MNLNEQTGGETPHAAAAAGKVGHCRPPVEHQFTKGKSGNPAGRPPGSKNRKPDVPDPLYFGLAKMSLEEAHRKVKVREGDKVYELPAYQAAVRAGGVAAIKGNRLALKHFDDNVLRAEATIRDNHLAKIKSAFEYKANACAEIARCMSLGLPDPGIIPHPDDIFIDSISGVVTTRGPGTKEEKADLEKVLARRTEAQKQVIDYADQHLAAETEADESMWAQKGLAAQERFNSINDHLPDRYKAKLKSRFIPDDDPFDGLTAAEYQERVQKEQRPTSH